MNNILGDKSKIARGKLRLTSARLAWLRFATCALIISILGISHCGAATTAEVAQLQADSPDYKPLKHLGDYYISGLNPAFTIAVKEGRIKPEEFELLDFKQPDEKGFGDNKAFEVFNPASERSIVDRKQTARAFMSPNELKKVITKDAKPKIGFNIRRTKNENGFIVDTLTLVIPNMLKEACESETKLVAAPTSLEIPLDNHTVTEDAASIDGCVETVEGRIYLLHGFYSRFKKPEDKEWQTIR